MDPEKYTKEYFKNQLIESANSMVIGKKALLKKTNNDKFIAKWYKKSILVVSDVYNQVETYFNELNLSIKQGVIKKNDW